MSLPAAAESAGVDVDELRQTLHTLAGRGGCAQRLAAAAAAGSAAAAMMGLCPPPASRAALHDRRVAHIMRWVSSNAAATRSELVSAAVGDNYQIRADAYRHMCPFKERIDLLGKIVFGQTFAAKLSEHLEIVRRYLDGVALDMEQLSTGAREQIGVLSRLACAMIVSPTDGGVPVIVDDALGWSDPARLRTMGAAIRTAGEHCQIIVLTCTPGRYSSIKNAKVVALSHDSANPAVADTAMSQPAAA